MSLTTSKKVFTIVLIIWLFTIFRSITIMIGGKKIFKKASKGEQSAYYPIINLFSMLEICDISTYYGILLFVPVANMVILTMMSYKLGSVFRAGFFYKIMLVLCPIIFYPILGSGKKIYKLKDGNYFKALDSVRNEPMNLMREEENTQIDIPRRKEKEEEHLEVDSIFKSDIELMEQVSPYKAAKIDLYGMQRLKNEEEEKKSLETLVNNSQNNEEKKDDVETMDL